MPPPIACPAMRRSVTVLLAAAMALVAGLVGAPRAGATQRHVAAAWTPAKGIAVDLSMANLLTDAQAMQIGSSLFSTLVTDFHANAVSFNFPFWQAGSSSNDPERRPMTPSPGRLAMLTELARSYGLAVQYRPYLYETNLVNMSRPSITPTNVPLWFQNYWTFLEPYLVSASQAGATSFSVALELTTLLPYLSDWERFVERARTVFPGQIFYSQQHDPQETIPFTERGYDAYQPILVKPNQISVKTFTAGFIKNLQMAEMQSTPADLTIEELGIPAVARAYLQPNYFHYSRPCVDGVTTRCTPIDRVVQTDWFAGACNAFYALHLAGIYYWSINFNTFTTTTNDTDQLYAWLGTPTAHAIQVCFARTS